MSNSSQTEQYFDALLASYDALSRAIEQANERGLGLSRQLLSEVTAAQRQTLDLAKQVAANPADMAAAYSAIMESAVAAQSQALDFTQTAYKEAVAASSEAREALDSLLNASRTAAEAALELSRDWQASNPWADLFQKGMESFTAATTGAAASKNSKPKAGAKA
jgi:hypothetical protein